MRKIKFRALKDDMSDCNFVYGCLVYDNDGSPRILVDKERFFFATCIKGTEGQYTELKDKNGKEIYEDDVILYDNREFVVKYEGASFAINNPSNDEDGYYLYQEATRDCEIIGNIHEQDKTK